MSMPLPPFLLAAAFTCNAIALHDVDGPIRCADGRKIRLQGIGATELDGSCRANQPCIPGDPRIQRRIMAERVIGAETAREDAADNGQLWFVRPVKLSCNATGHSHSRVTAWCRRPDGKGLSCGTIAAGIAKRWDRYWTRGPCPRRW